MPFLNWEGTQSILKRKANWNVGENAFGGGLRTEKVVPLVPQLRVIEEKLGTMDLRKFPRNSIRESIL